MFPGVPPYNDNYKLEPTEVLTFFHDEGGHDVAGTIRRLRIWGKELSKEDVAAICNCVLPPTDTMCKANLIHIPATSKLEYSSTYGNYQVDSRSFELGFGFVYVVFHPFVAA